MWIVMTLKPNDALVLTQTKTFGPCETSREATAYAQWLVRKGYQASIHEVLPLDEVKRQKRQGYGFEDTPSAKRQLHGESA